MTTTRKREGHTAGFAGWQNARVTCLECRGTGAEKPDCWLCRGNLTISTRKARRNGFDKDRLIGLEPTDSLCYCPACDASTCLACDGDGKVPPAWEDQERDRILICAAADHNEIPPRYTRYGADNDALLCLSVANGMRDIGVSRSLLSDCLHLRADDEVARAAKVRHALRGAWALRRSALATGVQP